MHILAGILQIWRKWKHNAINQSIKGILIGIPVWFSFSQYLASYLRSDFTLHIILNSFTNAITQLTMNIVKLILFLFSTKLDSSDYFIYCSFLWSLPGYFVLKSFLRSCFTGNGRSVRIVHGPTEWTWSKIVVNQQNYMTRELVSCVRLKLGLYNVVTVIYFDIETLL